MNDQSKASEIVLANAKRLLEDARLLTMHGRSRTAASIAILSMEESGKSCLIRWHIEGFLSKSGTREITSNHINKQWVFGALKFAAAAMDILGSRFFEQSISRRGTDDDLREAIAKAGFERSHTASFYAATGMTDFFKQLGFYTDVDQDMNCLRPDYQLSEAEVANMIEEAQEAVFLAGGSATFHRVAAAVYSVKNDEQERMSREDIGRAIDLAISRGWV